MSQKNFYKFQIGKNLMILDGRVKSTESFATSIKPARCEICTELLVAAIVGGNYTARPGMPGIPRMCDLCFRQFGDRALDMMNGG